MNDKSKLQTKPTVAVPLAISEKLKSGVEASETDRRMLLFRLSNAALRIRDEADLIRRTGFTDQASRLLRILGEAVEEQHAALSTKVEVVFDGEKK